MKHSYTTFLFRWLLLGLLLAGMQSAIAQQVNMELFKGMKARSIGPAGMSGRVTAIDVVLSNPDVIYVGTASGGLWKSEGGGVAWKPIFDTLEVASIGALAIQQSNPNVIWVGTGEGNPRNSQTSGQGVYKSIDAGRTWQRMGLEGTRNIHRVIIDPTNPDVVYVGAQGTAWGDSPDRGVFKTTDGGKTWNKILYVNPRTGIGELVMDPSNPNKLLANMWEFRRQPWTMQSGGPGSGLYMTLDGGKTWKKQSDADGLPKGDLGRMGLAFAPSKPSVVYALVESKKNALYRSEDGGFSWKMINDKAEIGDRPFYYFEIYVDPKNENRLYSIYSEVWMSEDGGKSFKVLLPYEGVHPDHHAWWIHPENPQYMIDGNDGGMAITRDGGKTWQFVENLPLAQYYHINVDNLIPYNVYGGMQDNGSWRGPAYVWREGGIRNPYFTELYFGDGFDVVPDPDQPEKYGYAMSQGGSLGRYNLETGGAKGLKPQHPDGTTLRFNWNAGIAQDPFNNATIYYGSQFVHKSTDKGETWTIISPDLTTNDPNKQKQLESGGLTYDVTAAENHCTILAIAPSPKQQGVIWVGTDDGNLNVTQDGGKTWTNVIANIKGLPKNCWIPQIRASSYNAGEAFVVLNNYRQNDWTPYIFQTTDFGKTWKRLVDNTKVWGYALSFIQDPIEPKLMFAGTEFGLYVSFDAGTTWNKWKAGYPTVSTMDLAIQPREHDLVIGTFGRSAYVLDDIRPLRAIAQKGTGVLQQEIAAFPAPDAYLADIGQAPGIRFAADAIFAGENRPFGAMLTFAVKEGKKDREKKAEAAKATTTGTEKTEEKPANYKVKIEIVDASGNVIRTFTREPETGINRIYWDMSQKGVRFPGAPKPKADADDRGGLPVMPGTYKLRFTYNGAKDSTTVKVLNDPRLNTPIADIEAWHATMNRMSDMIAQTTDMVDQLREAKEAVETVNKLLPKEETDATKKLKADGKAIQDEVKVLLELILQKEGLQGIVRNPSVLSAQLMSTNYALYGAMERPNANQLIAVGHAEKAFNEVAAKVKAFMDGKWAEYQKAAKAIELSPFKG